jgi:hypothetical protein
VECFSRLNYTDLGIGYWQAGNVFSVMANQDHFVGNDTNQANVVSNLNTAFKLYPDDDRWGFNDDALYAHDSLDAHILLTVSC